MGGASWCGRGRRGVSTQVVSSGVIVPDGSGYVRCRVAAATFCLARRGPGIVLPRSTWILGVWHRRNPAFSNNNRDMVWSLVPLVLFCSLIAGIASQCTFSPGGPTQGPIPSFDVDAALKYDAQELGFPVRNPVFRRAGRPTRAAAASSPATAADDSSTVGFITGPGRYIQLTQSNAEELLLVPFVAGGQRLRDRSRERRGSTLDRLRRRRCRADLGLGLRRCPPPVRRAAATPDEFTHSRRRGRRHRSRSRPRISGRSGQFSSASASASRRACARRPGAPRSAWPALRRAPTVRVTRRGPGRPVRESSRRSTSSSRAAS